MSLILDALRKAEAQRSQGPDSRIGIQVLPLPENRRQPVRRGGRVLFALAMLALPIIAVLYALRGDDPVTSSPATAPSLGTQSAKANRAPAPLAASESRRSKADSMSSGGSADRSAPATSAPSDQTPTSSKPPPSDSIALLSQLPDTLKENMPSLTVNGRIYSTRAAQRSAIINGQVYREQDLVEKDLILERIEPDAMVFRYRGQRFRLRDQ